MVHKKKLIALGHICLEDYYVDILESFENRELKQSKELYLDLGSSQKVPFFEWLCKEKNLTFTVDSMMKEFNVIDGKLLMIAAA